MGTTYYESHIYRFCTARGLERRESYSSIWTKVTGSDFECMTFGELRHCAAVMEDALSGKSTDTE